MKSDVLGSVMANMNPERARALTVKLADRLTLPQTNDRAMDKAADPAQPAPATAPGPQAAAAAKPASPAVTDKPAAPKS
jgi:flagellar motility protein MotE (MotC chaperone)